MRSAHEQRRVARLDYRNASYEGGLLGGRRDGFGLLLTDEAQLVAADWQLNLVEGRYCYVSRDIIAYGTTSGRQLAGFNCVRKQEATVYALFQRNKMHGKAVHVRNNRYCTMQFNRGELVSKTVDKPLSEGMLRSVLQKHFAEVPLDLEECLTEMSASCRHSETSFRRIDRNKLQHYFGFVDRNSKAKGLGMLIENDRLTGCGTFEDGEMHGLGRTYHGQQYKDGTYRKGVLQGVWVTGNLSRKEFTVSTNDKEELQQGDPLRVVREIHKEIHLRSTFFQNDLIVMERLLQLPIEEIFNSQLQLRDLSALNREPSSPTQNSRVFKRTGEQPSFLEFMKPKPSTDIEQEDEVSSGSPIKQIKAFQPMQSFRFDGIQPNYNSDSPKSNRAEPLSLFRKCSNILIQDEDRKSTKRPDMPFRTVATLETPKTEKSPARKKPQLITTAKSVRPSKKEQLMAKGAASLVRHMEQEEKRKRIDLDQIYRETGIVRARKLNR